MTLTIGTAPFGRSPGGSFNFNVDAPEHVLYLEDYPRRVRAILAGETVADTLHGRLLHETGHLPILYIPEEDLAAELLESTDQSTHCPFKGDASYRSVRTDGRVAVNAVWHYPEPLESAPPIGGLAAIHWHAMDAWFEEEEEVFGHLRNPYTRVDVRDSSRHVRVRARGEVVAETERPKLLFETSLPVRYYIPPEDVRQDLLSASDTHTYCPYKGTASYRSIQTTEEYVEDAAFFYPEPLPEASAVVDHLCFLGEGVETEVDP